MAEARTEQENFIKENDDFFPILDNMNDEEVNQLYLDLHDKLKPSQTIYKQNLMRLYHGDPDSNFKPYFCGGRDYHDYGKGLYCVDSVEFAKEWACQYSDLNVSYVYVYDVDLRNLPPILDLNTLPAIYWIAVLAAHRFERNEPLRRKIQREKLINMFKIDCDAYEIIKGWRADDSYYTYLRNFLRGDFSYEAVIQAMELGNLGQQYVIKGKKAYDNCNQTDRLIIKDDEYKKYFERYKQRDDLARKSLDTFADVDGVYIEDALKEGVLEKWKQTI